VQRAGLGRVRTDKNTACFSADEVTCQHCLTVRPRAQAARWPSLKSHCSRENAFNRKGKQKEDRERKEEKNGPPVQVRYHSCMMSTPPSPSLYAAARFKPRLRARPPKPFAMALTGRAILRARGYRRPEIRRGGGGRRARAAPGPRPGGLEPVRQSAGQLICCQTRLTRLRKEGGASIQQNGHHIVFTGYLGGGWRRQKAVILLRTIPLGKFSR